MSIKENTNTQTSNQQQELGPFPTTAEVPAKIKGSIIGGAAGDALGYAVEFLSYRDICRTYGMKGIQGYALRRGTGTALFSDDTQMTLFTAEGLVDACRAQASTIEEVVEYIRRSYWDWLSTQNEHFAKCPRTSWLLEIPELHALRAPGATCMSALDSGIRFSTSNPANNSKGCGGVMRVAPVGLLIEDPDKAALVAAEAAATTHGHPLGYISAAAMAFIVNRCVLVPSTASFKRALLAEIVEDCCARMPQWFPEEKRATARQAELLKLAIDLSSNELTDLENIRALGEGWVGEEALAIGVYSALRYPNDFGAAIRSAVNHDGDSDSTGSVCGNILGALVGLDGIGSEWTEPLEIMRTLTEVSEDLYRERRLGTLLL